MINNTVFIRGLEFSACHGVHDFEKVTPQRFIFDCDMFCDFTSSWNSDDVQDTVNYSAACNTIAETVNGNSFNLLEKLAYECAAALMDNFPLSGVKLTVNKPDAPVKYKFDSVGVCVELKRERVYLSLGSSMGERKKYLDRALSMLDSTRGVKVKKVSKYIQTEPYGGVARNTFLNCAAEVETYLPPHVLLREINRIEAACGRERKVRWADRTLDIDIIFYGGQIICDEKLVVPHREYYKRDFVLKPLKEIAPDFVCPLLKKRVSEL